MIISKILKIIGKNILAFLGGAALGILSVIFRFFPEAIKKVGAGEPSLGAVVLAPVLLVLYAIFGVLIGGTLGVIAYNALKLILKRKK